MAFASSGNEDEKGNKKWSELRLPGRVGEQVKARWENILDPNIKKGRKAETDRASDTIRCMSKLFMSASTPVI